MWVSLLIFAAYFYSEPTAVSGGGTSSVAIKAGVAQPEPSPADAVASAPKETVSPVVQSGVPTGPIGIQFVGTAEGFETDREAEIGADGFGGFESVAGAKGVGDEVVFTSSEP